MDQAKKERKASRALIKREKSMKLLQNEGVGGGGGEGGGGSPRSRVLAAGGDVGEDPMVTPPQLTLPPADVSQKEGVEPGIPLQVVTTKTITFEADRDDVSVVTGTEGFLSTSTPRSTLRFHEATSIIIPTSCNLPIYVNVAVADPLLTIVIGFEQEQGDDNDNASGSSESAFHLSIEDESLPVVLVKEILSRGVGVVRRSYRIELYTKTGTCMVVDITTYRDINFFVMPVQHSFSRRPANPPTNKCSNHTLAPHLLNTPLPTYPLPILSSPQNRNEIGIYRHRRRR